MERGVKDKKKRGRTIESNMTNSLYNTMIRKEGLDKETKKFHRLMCDTEEGKSGEKRNKGLGMEILES